MLFYPLYYNIISLTSLKITQAFHLLLDFAENQDVFLDFKIQNSIWIIEGSDNRDSDNRGSTVYVRVCMCMYVCVCVGMYIHANVHIYVCMYTYNINMYI